MKAKGWKSVVGFGVGLATLGLPACGTSTPEVVEGGASHRISSLVSADQKVAVAPDRAVPEEVRAKTGELRVHLQRHAPGMLRYFDALRGDYRLRHLSEVRRAPEGSVQSLSLYLHEVSHEYVPDLILADGELLTYQRRMRIDPPRALPLTEAPRHFLPDDEALTGGQNERYHSLYLVKADPDRRPFAVLLNELNAYTIDYAYDLSSFESLRRKPDSMWVVSTGLPYFSWAIGRYLDEAEHASYERKADTVEEIRRNRVVISRVLRQAADWLGRGCEAQFKGFMIDDGQRLALRRAYGHLGHQTLVEAPKLPAACVKALGPAASL
jgi:hypothetical protein